MSKRILFQSSDSGDLVGKDDPTRTAVEIATDPGTLLARLREAPEDVDCVVIPADLEDPVALAMAIRTVAPNADVLLRGQGPGRTRDLSLEVERLSAVIRLVAGVAHDLATPLTAILGYADLLGKSVEDEKSQRRAATIADQVRRVRNMVDALMELSLERETPRPVELPSLVERALAFHDDRLRRHHVAVERRTSGTARVVADPIHVYHAVLASLAYACDTLGKGGGTLSVEIEEIGAEARLRLAASTPPHTPPAGRDAPEPSTDPELQTVRSILAGCGGTLTTSQRPSEVTLEIRFRAADRDAS